MKALIIYDDVASAKDVVAALKRAAHRVKMGIRWDLKPWRLDILSLPTAGNEALLEAVDADIIAFAGPRASSLPPWLIEWLECWASLRQVSDAAVAVVGERDQDFDRTAVRFSRFAKSHGLGLLVENGSALEHGLASQSFLESDWRSSIPCPTEGASATV